MTGLPAWISLIFYGAKARGPALLDAVAALRKALPEGGTFIGDNLITFGKNLGFLRDAAFMEAFRRADPDDTQLALIWRLHTLCWAVSQAASIPGDFVEAGCYRGLTARVICNVTDFGKQPRTYWLYDAFDEADVSVRKLDHHSPGLHAEVVARFADLPNVRIVKGLVPESFSLGEPEQVAFLHIDMNSAPAEIATLERLYPRMPNGGIVVLDDYGWGAYIKQRDAHDRWFADRGRRVLELPTGQGIVVK